MPKRSLPMSVILMSGLVVFGGFGVLENVNANAKDASHKQLAESSAAPTNGVEVPGIADLRLQRIETAELLKLARTKLDETQAVLAARKSEMDTLKEASEPNSEELKRAKAVYKTARDEAKQRRNELRELKTKLANIASSIKSLKANGKT
jgi:chromosome segregation ATPase